MTALNSLTGQIIEVHPSTKNDDDDNLDLFRNLGDETEDFDYLFTDSVD